MISEEKIPTLYYPLREDLNIAFVGLPRNLTLKEVQRIVAFLESFSMEKSDES